MEIIDFEALLDEQYAILRSEIELEDGKSPERGNPGDYNKESQSDKYLLEKNANNNSVKQTEINLSRNDYSNNYDRESANELISKGCSDRFSPEMTKPELGNSGCRNENIVRSTVTSETKNRSTASPILAEEPYFDNKYGTSVSKNTHQVHSNIEMQIHARTDMLARNQLCSGGVSDKFSLEMTKPELGNSGFRNNTNQNTVHTVHTVHSECDIGRNDSPILPEVPYFNNNYGTAMSQDYPGYFIIPRSLVCDPRYKGARLKYKQVLLKILEHAAFAPTTHAIGSEIIPISIGQLCISERHLIDLCNEGVSFKEDKVDKNIVHRAVHFWARCQIVNHEVIHEKTLITVTIPEFYVKGKSQCETVSEPQANHKRTTKEEDKEDDVYKSNLYSTMSNKFSAESTDSVDSSYSQARPTRVERIFFNWESGKLEGIEQADIDGWQQAFSHINVVEYLKFIEQDISHKKTKYGRRKRIVQTVLVYLKNKNESQIAYNQRSKSNPYYQKQPQPKLNKDAAPRNPRRSATFVNGSLVVPEGFLED